MTDTRVTREGLSLGAVADLERRVAVLNRRASKLGVTALRVELGDVRVVKKLDRDGWEHLYEVRDVAVVGDTPKLAGWSLAAVLDHDGPETVTARVPGTEAIDLARYRDAKAYCDHCGTARRRLETFVLTHESDSRVTQVGRNCVADFLGGVSPQHLLWLAGWVREIAQGDFEERGPRPEHVVEPLEFLSAAAAIIRVDGWLSRTKAREQGGEASADAAWDLANPPHAPSPDRRAWEAKRAATDQDRELAEATLAWAVELDPADGSEYIANLGRLARKGWVRVRDAGLMASAVATFNRERVRAAELAASVPSTHLGVVGERLRMVEVKVLGRTFHESAWGSTALVKLVTPAGQKLKWWSAEGGSASLLRDGESYTVDLSVKSHDEWKGQLETSITRVSAYTAEGLALAREKAARKAAREAKRLAKMELPAAETV